MPQPQSSPPARYVVIGNPIAHSKSPAIHAAFAAQTGQNVDYQTLLAPVDGFNAAVRAFIASGGQGANVTLPFKLDAYALATELSERARAAGAVNTLTFDGDSIRGDNTDGVGLIADLTANAGCALQGRRVLLLGAGGAARGALLPLLQQQPGQLIIANRTLATAQQLVQQMQQHSAPLAQASQLQACELQASAYGALEGRFDLIINATSASLSASVPPLADSLFGADTLAYDMMYGKEPTVFMQFAANRGAMVRDGLGMLVEQAAEAFFLWRAVRPATAPVYASLRAQLCAQT
jgi:shikimate dehydrogenase